MEEVEACSGLYSSCKHSCVEPIEEDEEEEEEEDEEVDVEDDFSTENLALQQAPVLWETAPVVPGFWASGLSDEVVGRGPATSLRVRGKVLAIQVVPTAPAKMDKDLACQL